MKILVVYAKDRGGGFFRRLCRLLEALGQNGDEVHYISISEYPLKHAENIHFHKIPEFVDANTEMKLIHFLLFDFFAIPYSIYICKRKRIDVMIDFGGSTAFRYIIAKKLGRIPIVSFIRADAVNDQRLKNLPKYILKIYSQITKLSLNSSDKIISVSKELSDVITKRYCLNTTFEYLPNDIDTTKFYPRAVKRDIIKGIHVPNDDFLIGYFGTLYDGKKVDVLIRAFAKLKAEHAKLLIIGEGYTREKLRDLVKTLSIEKRVIFLGWQNNIEDFINVLDLVVLPSVAEGMPNTILEALGCEIPCLGSDIIGIREVLKYPELLFEPNNVDDLAARIEKLIFEVGYYRKIKDLCVERKKEFVFDWDKRVVEMISKQNLLRLID